jgi:hypothetical protein
VFGNWSAYQDYSFYGNDNAIQRSDEYKARELADYLNRNPTARVGIDGSHEARVFNVRDAMLNAGVPAHRIALGDFSDPQLRNDGRVDVLVSGG